MNVTEIQSRVNLISSAMTGKGLREPEVQFTVSANKQVHIYLRWKDVTRPTAYLDNDFKFFYADEPKQVLDEADVFVASMPSAEETKFRQFMGALGNVIDLGKSNGIEVEFLNPLQATMKKLSDNILTDQRVAAE